MQQQTLSIREDVKSRCRRHVELVRKTGWYKDDEAELKQYRDMINLYKLLDKGEEFRISYALLDNRADVIWCDYCIFFVLQEKELAKLERDFQNINTTAPDNDYGHFLWKGLLTSERRNANI